MLLLAVVNRPQQPPPTTTEPTTGTLAHTSSSRLARQIFKTCQKPLALASLLAPPFLKWGGKQQLNNQNSSDDNDNMEFEVDDDSDR